MIISVIGIRDKEVVNAKDTITYDRGNGYQTIVDSSGDTIYEIQFMDEEIIITGIHAKSSATISYRTIGFNISLSDDCINGNVPFDNPEETIEVEQIGKPNDEVKEDYVITTYRLKKAYIFETITQMLFKKYNYQYDELQDKFAEGIPVYLNNIFEMVERPGGSGTTPTQNWGRYETLEEIMNAPIKSGYGSWGSGTQEVLPHYFGMVLILKKDFFDLEIEYYDTVNKKVVGTDETTRNYEVGQTLSIKPTSYTKVGEKYQVTYNGVIYNLAGNSILSYDGLEETTEYDTFTPTIIMTTGADSILRIPVEPAETECKVKIQYVNESGKVIKDNIEGGGFNNGEAYSYESYEEMPYINSRPYEYTNKWSCSYTNKSGQTKDKKGTGSPGFTISDAKADSTLLLKLIYKEKDDEEIVQEDFIEHFEPAATGVIKADNRGSEKFDVTAGIPTTESLYTNVLASEYLIRSNFNIIMGVKNLPIKVTKEYILQWYKTIPRTAEEIRNGVPPTKILMETSKIVTKVVNVKRTYKYTEISKIEYYKINKAVLNNGALPDSVSTLIPQGYSVPSLNYQHYVGENEHIIYPVQVEEGIDLGVEVIPPKGNGRGSIPNDNFTALADSLTDPIQVRNDYMEFESNVVLDNGYVDEAAPELNKSGVRKPEIINKNVLYDDNLTIEATKNNGMYSSSGRITYEKVVGFQSSMSDSVNYSVNGLNKVIIHTPVYCDAALVNDNNQYVQLLEPDLTCVPIVLDEDGISSDFIVDISNTGFHSFMKGYKERDYSINTKKNASYIAKSNGILRNEVKFPFDVFIDIGSDKNTDNDELIFADTWYTVGLNKYRFYVPGYVKEGIYTVDFRTVAVNGTNKLSAVQSIANSSRSYYVATDTVKVQISGKIYGLTLYDIHDYPKWKDIFRVYRSTKLKINEMPHATDGTIIGRDYDKKYLYYYTVGTNDQYGLSTGRSETFTIPLIEGSHPREINQGVQKAGYTWRFTLDTFGSVMLDDTSYVTITPRFYYVDTTGKNREEVDLYYDEKINGKEKTVVKVGGKTDLTNRKKKKVREVYFGIPENELSTTAELRNISLGEWITQVGELYGYSSIKSNKIFKTFTATEYADYLMYGNNAKYGRVLVENLVLWSTIAKTKQSYYFEYSLPSNVKAVSKGFDVVSYTKKKGLTYDEDFWKKDGYIIINVDITAYDKNGKAYMSYINADNYINNNQCCMWIKEGAPKTKKDYYGTRFDFKAGDFLMIYTDQTSEGDYGVGGIY